MPRCDGAFVHIVVDGQARQIALDSPAWQAWLAAPETACFAAVPPLGPFTARGETRRGRRYWYAYRKRGGRLTKRYLGTAAALTAARLRAVAADLEGDRPAAWGAAGAPPPPPAMFGLEPPFLAAKLTPPPARADLLERPRLRDWLAAGQRSRLLLVTAPAGAGKTTLLGAWQAALARDRRPVVWLALDEADDDPARFWGYLALALDRLLPGTASAVATLLQANPLAPNEAVVGRLIEAAAALPPGTVIMLDDYHLVTTTAIHEVMTRWIEHLPAGLTIVLASRSQPPLPVARWRARGELIELTAAELACTAAETATLLTEVLGLTLDPAALALVGQRTEGWLAGLRLVAVALAGQADLAARLADFGGAHRFVGDYLTEEVLRQQPGWAQRFLLWTAFLPRLTGPLCEAVLADDRAFWPLEAGAPTTGQAALEWLERANIFLVALDEERRWFRYHTLFAEFLQHRLRQTEPALVPALRRRASDWYAAAGLPDEALDQAVAAADWARVEGIVTAALPPRLLRGELATMRRWLARLPAAVLDDRPALGLAAAWVALVGGQLEVLTRRLARLDAAPPALAGEVALLHAALAATNAEIEPTRQWIARADAALPPESAHRATLAVIRGAVDEWRGDLPAADRLYATAVTTGLAGGNLLAAHLARLSLAQVRASQGYLRAVAAIMRQLLRETSDEQVSAGLARCGLGSILYEWNALSEAEEHFRVALALGQRWQNRTVLLAATLGLARLAIVRQAWAEAAMELEQARHLAPVAGDPWTSLVVDAIQVQFWLARGDTAAAVAWADQYQPEPVAALGLLEATIGSLVAWVREAAGDAAGALGWVDRLLPALEASGHQSEVIGLLVVAALARARLGQTTRALASLRRALTLAAGEGFRRVFLDAGPGLAGLLSLAARREHRRPEAAPGLLAVIEALLADIAPSPATASPAPDDPAARAGPPPLEALSRREREVLALLAIGHTNRAIADQLFIEVSTVKRHVHQVLAKLGATNRTQAVARARALALL